MAYLTGFDRRQAQFFPTYKEGLSPELAEMGIIDMYVNAMDMTQPGIRTHCAFRTC